MRYLWDLYPVYLYDWSSQRSRRILLALLSNYLRMWDVTSAARVDDFLANSANVQRRIRRAYRRESEIVYPPVDTARFFYRAPEDYFLIVSALVEYKRIRDAVEYFSQSGRKLKIVGEGPQYRSLRSIASPDIEFCGRVSDSQLPDLYARCRAVILPGEEDFGIVPVEALASGKPVIALGRGGVLETVPTRNPCAGFFYDDAGPRGLASAVSRFESTEHELRPSALQRAALRFSKENFLTEMSRRLHEYCHSSPNSSVRQNDQRAAPTRDPLFRL
jgi:glycosyltransferase involved in cell wall biosynthesis